MSQLAMFSSDAAQALDVPTGPAFIYVARDGDEIVVDSFAGGGGASEGIRRALGYSPHVAINHDAPAIALHAANHPDSTHYPNNVWRIDPVAVCAGRPVGLMWLSPDCTHFSKAKGSKPVSKKIRGLAWVAVRWAKAVHPRIIILENVEEFEKWGPLHAANHADPKLRGRPIVAKQGRTYRAFVRKLERLGYAVERRQLVACDYGAPTSRKRLFIIARCDGEPIVWPKPTHGVGRAHPWRTAAECIDWSIPCPSIFITKAEAKSLGFNVKRPLVENTLRRIGRGVWRFVINSPKPFIVPYHSPKSASEDRTQDVSAPLPTLTAENRFSVVTPFITKFRTGSTGSPIDTPMPTVTANSYIVRPGGAVPMGLVSPFLAPVTHPGDQRVHSIEEPMRTIIGANRGEEALIAPVMIPRYGEWPNHPARGTQLDAPMPTVVPTQNGAQLCATFLAKHFGGHETPGSQIEAPMDTVTGRDHHAVVAAHISKFYGDRIGSRADEPLGTVMATSAKHAVVAAHIQRDFGQSVGAVVDGPMPTITGGAGGHAAVVASSLVHFKSDAPNGVAAPLQTQTSRDCFGLVASNLVKLHGTCRDGQPVDEPAPTIRAQGNHIAEVRAFLTKYHGTAVGQDLQHPLHTVDTNDRYGVVTVQGVDYIIYDIGMRMLVPRELARAQGFEDSYILDIVFNGKPLSKEAQTSMIGNSVPPDDACALVKANYRPRTAIRERVA